MEMDDHVKMKPKLEDILFLNPTYPNYMNGLKLLSLSDAFDNKKSNTNLKKLLTEQNTSQKHLYEKITDEVMEKKIVDDMKGKYYPGFVKYFKSNYKESLDKSMKNAEKSVEKRVKASKLFAQENHDVKVHEDIWKLYSKSIAFAPVESKELVLAYECRSNLLLHLKKHKDCVKDIDRALAITEFPLLKVKLLCRKMTCFVAMNKDINEKMDLWLSIKDEFKKIHGPLRDEKFLKIFRQAKCDSTSHPTNETEKAEGSLVYQRSNTVLACNKEVSAVANRDFVPGEEVFVTKPLVTSSNPDKCYAYCSHCLSFMWAGIPCDECSLCLYCSDDCKKVAWEKYHVLECKILPHINFDDIIYFDLQTCVKVFLMGLREFGSIPKLKEAVDKLKDKSLKNDEFCDSNFLHFYTQPMKDRNMAEIVAPYVKNACFLVAYLIETCDIFGQDLKLLRGKELCKNNDVVFCGVSMFKILLLCAGSGNFPDQIYTKKPKCPENRCRKKGSFKRCCYRGKVFHPFQRIFEKSCNPNVARFWADDGKIIVLCVQPIKEMEKIVYTNSIEFFSLDIIGRDKYGEVNDSLKYCSCDPCIKGWPTMTEMYKKFKQRKSKSDKNELKILQIYLEKNNMETDKVVEKNWALSESEFQELAKDVNNVVKVCGQPSFASSFLISILCTSYEKKFGTTSLQAHIPVDC